jgi:peroxiredoxin
MRLALAAALLLGLGLVALFARALPEATGRAREAGRRAREAACDALAATVDNPALGRLPAPAPDFTLRDFAGRELRLSSLRGQVVLVNFWATWCQTCAVEMPSMERLVQRMAGRPFRLLAVSVDEDWATVRRYFSRGTPLEILLDSARDTPRRYGTEKFPESFIVDKQGMARYYVVSDRDWASPDITACLEALVE